MTSIRVNKNFRNQYFYDIKLSLMLQLKNINNTVLSWGFLFVRIMN